MKAELFDGSVLVGALGAIFWSIWWVATSNERLKQHEKDIKQNKKDIDGLADIIGTERAKSERPQRSGRSR